MKKNESKNCVKKLLDYAVKIDMIWLVIWGTIFSSFVVLDSIFQTAYPGRDIYYQFEINNSPHVIQIVGNGTFVGVTILKYIGIVLSFIYARKKFPKDYVLQIALAFTLLADTILTFDQVSVFGVLAFCFAQYFHIARFAKVKPKFFVDWTLFLVLLLIFGWFNGIPDMYILAIVYGSCLIGNISLTRRWWLRTRKSKDSTDRELVASTCAFSGFILFLLCDTNVAISYLSVTGVLPLFIARYANFFAWLFYYPSQVLISNSSIITEKPRKIKKTIPLNK